MHCAGNEVDTENELLVLCDSYCIVTAVSYSTYRAPNVQNQNTTEIKKQRTQ